MVKTGTPAGMVINPVLFSGASAAVLCYLGDSNKSNHSDGPNTHRTSQKSEHSKACWDFANLNYLLHVHTLADNKSGTEWPVLGIPV